jgi:hypothetical protein
MDTSIQISRKSVQLSSWSCAAGQRYRGPVRLLGRAGVTASAPARLFTRRGVGHEDVLER